MGFASRVGWGLLALLVALGMGLMFWLEWLLGAVFALFVALVLWYVFGVLKKKVDTQLAGPPNGWVWRWHPILPLRLAGRPLSGPAGEDQLRKFAHLRSGIADGHRWSPTALAALDARNITLLRLDHQLAPAKKTLLDPGPPPVLAKNGQLRLAPAGGVHQF